MELSKAITIPVGVVVTAGLVGVGFVGRMIYDRWSAHSYSTYDASSHLDDSSPNVALAGPTGMGITGTQHGMDHLAGSMDWSHH